jgi:stearoyl-CoA desaturase (delta-9 desaturase)
MVVQSMTKTHLEEDEILAAKRRKHVPDEKGDRESIDNLSYHGNNAAWWIVPSFIIMNHVFAIYGLFFHRMASVDYRFFVWCGIMCFLSLLGITAGYHRLWSHRAYSANLPLRIFLMFIGSISFQGSAKWWVLRHRTHHRWTDTQYDPYDSTRGLWYSHFGWLLEKPKVNPMFKLVNMSDLSKDPVANWQSSMIGYPYVVMGLMLPSFIGYLYSDPWAGVFWLGIMARVISWHGIFAVNSLAHYVGDKKYQHDSSAKASLLVAIMSNGEGNHNYHHTFPKDFRHGITFFEWDPTKWFIMLAHELGMAYDLWETPEAMVKKCEIECDTAKLLAKKRTLQHTIGQPLQALSLPQWTSNANKLPVWNQSKFERESQDRLLILIDGFAVEIDHELLSEHPGGPGLLSAFRGKDATHQFYGKLNIHSAAAHIMVEERRVAKIAQ